MEPPVGTHLLLELRGCPCERLEDAAHVREAVGAAVRAAGATLVDVVLHAFPGGGVTALALLAESHLSVHTWPEHGYAAVDVFTCGADTEPEAAARAMAAALGAAETELRSVRRGVSCSGSESGVERIS